MRERFSIGSVARLYFDLIVSGAGQTNQVPMISIQRGHDGYWFNETTQSFGLPMVTNTMRPLDAANLPGRYYFDFDHATDLLVSREFVVKKANAGPPPALAYDDLCFGKLPAARAPALCSIQGTLVSATGKPLANALVQATVIPVFADALGRGLQSDTPVRTYSAP